MLKVKTAMVSELLSNSNLDGHYVTIKAQKWTRRDIAKEIQNETGFGIKQLNNILLLSLDILTRNAGKEFMRDEDIKELLK